jgi:DNA-binding transcriptional ArsR family regulator
MKIDNPVVKDAHVLLHPTRYKIAELLSENPMHLRELSEALGKEIRLISYHLFVLEEHGFVNGKFEFPQEANSDSNSKEITMKQYGVTKKGRFSYNLIILDKERIEADENDPFRHPESKRELVRVYSPTEKVDGVLSELKRSL